jgi:membrane-associated phospholipid phosphatase
MSYLLDVIGSFAVGALVILMLFRFNQTMLSASNEKLLYNISQLRLL